MPRFSSISELIASYESRFVPEAAAGVDTIVQMNLAGDPAIYFYMTIKDQVCSIENGKHNNPELIVTSSVSDWMKLNNRQADAMVMMMTGKIKIQGPMDIAMKFRSMFKD